MHNHRRDQFFRAQRRARARGLILDRYIAERVASHEAQQSGEGASAALYALESARKPEGARAA